MNCICCNNPTEPYQLMLNTKKDNIDIEIAVAMLPIELCEQCQKIALQMALEEMTKL